MSPTLRTDPDMGFLFVDRLDPKRGLATSDYVAAATALDVEVAMIMAVAEVESPRGPFDSMGRPEILFERHYFHRLTGGQHDTDHPDISNRVSGGYGKFSTQYGKLQRAYALNCDAALRSASWGRFQIMGDNYRSAGFESAAALATAMIQSEAEHLRAFVSFVKSNKAMTTALKQKDWAGFAARYNGPGYKKNAYDTKLAQAYTRFSGSPPTA
jgi:N-acetylmuramidase